MRWVYVRVMALDLWRDKGSLVMAFVLPGVVFVIFASIFSAAAGGEITPRVAVLDQRQSPASERLVSALIAAPQLEISEVQVPDRQALLAAVREGRVDAGIVVRAEGSELSFLDVEKAPPIEVVYDPLRGIAANLSAGVVQRVWAQAFPEASIRMALRVVESEIVPLSDAQRRSIDAALAAMAEAPEAFSESSGGLLEMQAMQNQGPAAPSVTYYAGAVSMLFLMLASLNGALSLLDDKQSGLFDRLSMGPAGAGALLYGRFLFIWMQGALQVTVIYLVAWSVFGVDLPGHFLAWLLVSLAAAACVAALALCFASICNTRQQAQTFGHIAVLLLAAIGGSMVPRFLMPIEMQQLGWLTPNTWALEAYMAVFRGLPLLDGSAALGLGLLLATTLLALAIARLAVARTNRCRA